MIPTSIQILHELENHNHSVCTSKVEQHIHEKEIDCSLHLIKQSDSFLATNHYKIITKIIIFNTDNLQYSFLKNHHQLSFSLRGPPRYVLA
jgi:hypothetical protein